MGALTPQPELSFFDQGVIMGSGGYNRLSYRRNMTVLDLNQTMGRAKGAPDDKSRETYRRVVITGPSAVQKEEKEACELLERMLELRDRFITDNPDMYRSEEAKRVQVHTVEPKFVRPSLKTASFPPPTAHKFRMVKGVFEAWLDKESDSRTAPGTKRAAADAKVRSGARSRRPPPPELKLGETASGGAEVGGDSAPAGVCREMFRAISANEFFGALREVMETISHGPCKTYSYNRLRILEARFQLHLLLNDHLELLQQKTNAHRDFYNVRKIDNHVHHSACMNQKHLLRYIKHTVKNHPKDIVTRNEEGKERTLEQVFADLGLTTYDLSIDTLNMRAEKTFHRFDKFNTKYNPVGQPLLREIFLKQNNFIKGRYLARLTQQVFDDLEFNKYQHAEYRISIYGRKRDEWATLAAWVVDNELWSSNVCWMIQVPRLYKLWRKLGFVRSFAEMLDLIFRPLFEATVDPSRHRKLHLFLQNVVAFDSVDDESQREQQYFDQMPTADEWTFEQNPPYSVWSYYMYANIAVLNKLRLSKGLNTFAYRPHAGEAGDVEHLAATFLVANGINHGIQLYHSPVLQYAYYLAQIGISISPLSNNLLFCKYEDNPFPRFFRRGLNVTLSTDDPLMIHVTKEPLVEEYSVAAQVWKLTSTDLCEIARNSVLQSGYPPKYKAHWVGQHYWRNGPQGNDVNRTNVPNIRVGYRWEILQEELATIRKNRESKEATSSPLRARAARAAKKLAAGKAAAQEQEDAAAEDEQAVKGQPGQGETAKVRVVS